MNWPKLPLFKKNNFSKRKTANTASKVFGLQNKKVNNSSPFHTKVRKIYSPSNTTLENHNTKNTKKIDSKLSVQIFFSSLWFTITNLVVIKFFLKSSRFFGLLFILFFIYICFIDTTFVIKKITIEFEKDSFLDKQTIAKLDSTIKNYRYFGVIPANSMWFANSYSYNQLSKDLFDEVQSVEIVNTTWPNTLTLKVATKPILATLSVNNGSNYIVVAQNGTILGRDNYNLRSNIVSVNSLTNVFDDTTKTFLFDTSQLEKLYFLDYMSTILSNNKLTVNKKIISSLSAFDSTTIINLSNNTLLFFDNTALDKEYLKRRVETILSTPEIAKSMNEGVINYIDFRSIGKVFVCNNKEKCALDNSIK
jgi:hypothetical protein